MRTTFLAGLAHVTVHESGESLANAAADEAAGVIAEVIRERGAANVMFASGNSQLRFLEALLDPQRGVDWRRVEAFHMDEYIGMTADHPASFQRFMRERIVSRVSLHRFHYLRGDEPDSTAETERYAALLERHSLDLCLLGIGENGHLAFNDPPVADFEDPVRVKVVALDEQCRSQQVGEGHFGSFAEVPTHAITVTIPALLSARVVIAIVHEARKSKPVRAALEGPISTACPASALRQHPRATIHLDEGSAAGLQR